MGMSKERIVFVSLAGIAGAGLMVDRLFLAPDSADASTPASDSGFLSEQIASATGSVQNAIQTTLKDKLQGVIEKELAGQAGSLQFGPAQAWVQAPQIVSPAAIPGQATQLTLPPANNQPADPLPLTMVMPTSDGGGLAVIGGVRLRVGEVHPDGFRLIKVDARTATIIEDGQERVLTMRFGGR